MINLINLDLSFNLLKLKWSWLLDLLSSIKIKLLFVTQIGFGILGFLNFQMFVRGVSNRIYIFPYIKHISLYPRNSWWALFKLLYFDIYIQWQSKCTIKLYNQELTNVWLLVLTISVCSDDMDVKNARLYQVFAYAWRVYV